MTPDLRKPIMGAAASLAGAVLVAGLLCWWFLDDGGAAERRTAGKAKVEALRGDQEFTARLAQQRAANDKLRSTIDSLKTEVGFTIHKDYVVPKGTTQPGYFFRTFFEEVQANLRDRAQSRSVDFDQGLGFETDVPDDKDVPDLLRSLQLTHKAVGCVLAGDITRMERFTVTHGAPVLAGSSKRPPLLREFPLTLTVTASLPDILWILHRFAVTDAKMKDDYPLALRGLKIASPNQDENQEIQVLEATFDVAAMEFLSEADRAKFTPTGPGALTTSGGTAGSAPARVARP